MHAYIENLNLFVHFCYCCFFMSDCGTLHGIVLFLNFFPLHFQKGSTFWNNLDAPDAVFFPWDAKSTYIRCPPFFNKLVSHLMFQRQTHGSEKTRVPELPSCVFSLLSLKTFVLLVPLIMHTFCCFWGTKSPLTTSLLPAALHGSAQPPSTCRANGNQRHRDPPPYLHSGHFWSHAVYCKEHEV